MQFEPVSFERRYNLIIDNNIKVMLPKKIDHKLIIFIEKNLELLKKLLNILKLFQVKEMKSPLISKIKITQLN